MMLPITLTIAGAAALLNVWLGLRVSRLRRQYNVSIGHGGKSALATRTRSHSNFIEYTPFFLILLGLAWGWRRTGLLGDRPRPNNSFKPKPLRGSA